MESYVVLTQVVNGAVAPCLAPVIYGGPEAAANEEGGDCVVRDQDAAHQPGWARRCELGVG